MRDKFMNFLKPPDEIVYQNLNEDENEYCDYNN